MTYVTFLQTSPLSTWTLMGTVAPLRLTQQLTELCISLFALGLNSVHRSRWLGLPDLELSARLRSTCLVTLLLLGRLNRW